MEVGQHIQYQNEYRTGKDLLKREDTQVTI